MLYSGTHTGRGQPDSHSSTVPVPSDYCKGSYVIADVHIAIIQHSILLEYGIRPIKMLGPGRPKHLGVSLHRESKTYMSHLQRGWSHDGYRLSKTFLLCLRSRIRVCQAPTQQPPNRLAQEPPTPQSPVLEWSQLKSVKTTTKVYALEANAGTATTAQVVGANIWHLHAPPYETLAVNVLCPNVACFAFELDQYPGMLFVDSVLYTLHHGCHAGYPGPRFSHATRNLLSVQECPDIVTSQLEEECKKAI